MWCFNPSFGRSVRATLECGQWGVLRCWVSILILGEVSVQQWTGLILICLYSSFSPSFGRNVHATGSSMILGGIFRQPRFNPYFGRSVHATFWLTLALTVSFDVSILLLGEVSMQLHWSTVFQHSTMMRFNPYFERSVHATVIWRTRCFGECRVSILLLGEVSMQPGGRNMVRENTNWVSILILVDTSLQRWIVLLLPHSSFRGFNPSFGRYIFGTKNPTI